MFDPENLTFMQWFWICFAIVLAVFFLCRWLDLETSVCFY